MDINEVLEQHSFQVQNLLRRHRVMGEPNIDTIKRAHDRHGESFMLKLLNVITPTSNFTGELTPISPFVSTGSTLDTKTLAVSASSTSGSGTGKVWTFWEKLLNGISSAGETIGGLKDNLGSAGSATGGTPGELAEPAQVMPTRSKLIYIAAGFLVLVIVLILLFRKK